MNVVCPFCMYTTSSRLVVLVVILALANLGTSFASAILAKDTTTNTNGELIDKRTNEAVATAQAVKEFEVHQEENKSGRELCTSTGNGNKEYNCNVDNAEFTEVDSNVAFELLDECDKNKLVRLKYLWQGGSTTYKTVCNPDWSCSSGPIDIVKQGNTITSAEGKLCIQDDDNHIFIRPKQGVDGKHTISASDPNDLTGDAATETTGADTCTVNSECDDGLVCVWEGPGISGTITQAQSCANDNSCGEPSESCIDTGKGKMCSQCNFSTNEGCDASSSRPTCIERNGDGVGICACDEKTDCGTDATCGDPSCIADVFPYCSTNHDADYGCGTCRDPAAGIVGWNDPILDCGTDCDHDRQYCVDDGTGNGLCACVSCGAYEKSFFPVCGNDGVTYENSGHAECVGCLGKNEYTAGECTTAVIDFDGPIDILCTEELDPVCGNDGISYSNTCQAIKAGVDDGSYLMNCACIRDGSCEFIAGVACECPTPA